MAQLQQDARHYTVLGLIGQGGHGRVYHARMHSGGGFQKDVAIKLLKDEDVHPKLLQRFRDEARILGLIRDRAIVTVDPPARLGGRWAIIMEYVEGVSALQLLRATPLPPTVALEIVQEVARVLDKVYRAAGPDGRPLHLVHRDIKPGNIQITRDGDVKLLDFGIARADFEGREAMTGTELGGTFGFIAPERLVGIDSPASDMYALGVTLRVFLTAEKATGLEPGTFANLPAEALKVAMLAEDLRCEDHERRPTAREVERLARELRAQLDGPTLREWADTEVPKQLRQQEDELVGSVLTESFDLEQVTGLTQAPRSRLRILFGMGLMASSAMILGGLAAFVLLVAAGLFLLRPTAPAVRSVPVPVSAPAPAPVPAPLPAPAPLAPPIVPGPATPVAPAAPKPAVPKPEPAAAALVTVDITAATPSQVYLDGVRIGVTPLRGQPVGTGSHLLRLVAPDGSAVEGKVMMGGRRGATHFDWTGGPSIAAR